MSTVGTAVPLILIPRFSSYIGPGTYASAPLDVSAYNSAAVTLWRGPLVGDTDHGAAFECWFEESQTGGDDPSTWVRVMPPIIDPVITTVDRSDDYGVPILRKWLRIVIVLTADEDDVVAISCWAAGLLEMRVS